MHRKASRRLTTNSLQPSSSRLRSRRICSGLLQCLDNSQEVNLLNNQEASGHQLSSHNNRHSLEQALVALVLHHLASHRLLDSVEPAQVEVDSLEQQLRSHLLPQG